MNSPHGIFRYVTARVFGARRSDFRDLTSSLEKDFGGLSDAPRVMFITSNGAGLGHLMRVSAIARHCSGPVLIYTLSSAYSRVPAADARVVYFPSYGQLSMRGASWNAFFAAHLGAAVAGFQPEVIVFDGTYVYRDVVRVTRRFDIKLIWLQRGCWKISVAAANQQRKRAHKLVDKIIVPSDLGCEEPTEKQGKLTPVSVGPIVHVPREDMLPKDEAIKALGLPSGKHLLLISLGSGVLGDTTNLVETAVCAVEAIGNDWVPVIASNPLGKGKFSSAGIQVDAVPLGRYLKAFDASVQASGYNSVQESLSATLPTVFVPNSHTRTDDQVRRAEGVAEKGLGLVARTRDELVSAINLLSESRFRQMVNQQLQSLNSSDGAREAAHLIQTEVFRGCQRAPVQKTL